MYVARLVHAKDVAPCETEQGLLQRGFSVTRLRAQEVCVGPALDVRAVRLLGQMYDAIIVPDSLAARANEIEVTAGVPVVPERELASI